MRRISGLVVGSLVSSLIVCQAAQAARTQDYTAAQFLSALNGLGYAVPLNGSINDPRVQQGIRQFQLEFRLPVDGRLNNPSQDRLAEIVRALQLGLNRTVSPSPQLPGSQFYGKQTEDAVKRFQQQNRLPATGIATLETRQRLNAVLNDEFPRTEGSSGFSPQTGLSIYTEAEIKEILTGFGYDINPQAALSNQATVNAIRDFQKIYGLSETGQIDRRTEEKISSVMRNLRNSLRIILRSNFAIAQYYDAATRAAVSQFQSRYGFRVNGIASLNVRVRIDDEARRLQQS